MLDRYVAQVRQLLSTLPDVANETVFAFKGGTGIYLYYKDMPRLSVDMDLTHTPVADRLSSFKDIDDEMTLMTRNVRDFAQFDVQLLNL